MKIISALTTLILVCNVAFAGFHHEIPVKPYEEITTGDFCHTDDKDFDGFRYPEQMAYCKRNVNASVKERIYAAYNIPKRCRGRYTIDHFVPLALGGNNADGNLWPEHVLVKATRKQLEQDAYLKVVNGTLSAAEAAEKVARAKMKLDIDLSDVEGCG